MKRLNGFSLVEMMIVLLIVAIIAAATAPMVNRKTLEGAAEKSPWVWTYGQNIAYNLKQDESQTAVIGEIQPPSGVKSRLYINIDKDDIPQISFGFNNKSDNVMNLFAAHNGNIWFSSEILNTNTENAVLIGNSAETNGSGNVVIGNRATAKDSSIAFNKAKEPLALAKLLKNVAPMWLQPVNAEVSSGSGSSGSGSGYEDILDDLTSGGPGGSSSSGGGVMPSSSGSGSSSGGSSSSSSGGGEEPEEPVESAINNSVAIGNSATVSGGSSVAIGNTAVTRGNGDSIAIGANTIAGTRAIAIGTTSATENASVTNAIQNSISIGRSVLGQAIGSIAIGQDIFHDTSATNSITLGQSISMDSSDGNSIVIGRNVNSGGIHDSIIIGGRLDTPDTDEDAVINPTRVENCIIMGAGADISSTNKTANKAIVIGDDATITSSSNENNNINSAIVIGNDASLTLSSNSTAQGSIVIGNRSEVSAPNTGKAIPLESAMAIGNTAKAHRAYAIALGTEATASGASSVAIGNRAQATGTSSVAIGADANATGASSVALGAGAIATRDNQIVLGTPSSTVYIPGKLVVAKDTLLGKDAGSKTYMRMRVHSDKEPDIDIYEVVRGWNGPGDGRLRYEGPYNNIYSTSFSDRRLKNVGKAFVGGLEEIKKLEVFNYTYKKDKTKTPHVGVIAQDLQKIFPDAVFKGEDGFFRIRMEDMFYAVVNAIKELDLRLTNHAKQIDELKKENQELKMQNQELVKSLESIEKRLAKLEKNK